MFVHRSNSAAALARLLCDQLAGAASDPLAPECIIVQGRGLERWLSQELATQLGTWALPAFPFPRRFLEDVMDKVLGPLPGERPQFVSEDLTWLVHRALPDLAARGDLPELAPLLADDGDGRRRMELAMAIARTLDAYGVWRPELLARWARGHIDISEPDEAWQAKLFRALTLQVNPWFGQRAEALAAALRGAPPAGLPARVSVFGVSALAPIFLELLAALGRHVPVHLFVLSPTQEWWGDQRRDDPDTLPLLGSLGRLFRDFQTQVVDRADVDDAGDAFHDPGHDSLLHALQSDFLALRRRAPGERHVLGAQDTSVQVHSCHGRQREVEVLHDQLLALLEQGFAPHEIAVMTPEIEAYAPYLDAVFQGGAHRIPLSISDRTPRHEEPVLAALSALLDAAAGRLGAPCVIDLLHLPLVRERAQIPLAQLDALTEWIQAAGIRWGIDAAHRTAEGLPPLAAHTWEEGLDRLFLGYATGALRAPWAGLSPAVRAKGQEAELLGHLARFVGQLVALHHASQESRSPADWAALLADVAASLIAEDPETTSQHQALRAALAAVAGAARRAVAVAPVSLAAFRLALAPVLDAPRPARGFLSGGVTVCDLVPMRAIPFRVVCLLGMGEGSFPRRETQAGFDLMKRHPLRGDRSPRDDDRGLFLEALLSAQERLLVTYVGQRVEDNAAQPPSSVVSELLETLDEIAVVAPGSPHATVRQALTVAHPLQPFSARYFGGDPDPRLFSYAARSADGARAHARGGTRPPFFPGPLPAAPASAARTIALEELVAFFTNPARSLLKALGVSLPRETDALSALWPGELDPLERWKLRDELLRIAPGELAARHEPMAGEGALPPAALGRAIFADNARTAALLERAAHGLRGGPELAPLDVDVHLPSGVRLVGKLGALYPGGRVVVSPSVPVKNELSVWIQHLALCATVAGGPPLGRSQLSYLVALEKKPRTKKFRSVDDAGALLDVLVTLFDQGHLAPLPLFRETSRAYADACANPKKVTDPWAAAAKKFNDRDWSEASEANVEVAFRGRDPLDPASHPNLGDVVEQVYGPLLAHEEDA